MQKTHETARDEPRDASLRLLQRVEKRILEQVVAVCERHGLTYYISGGTFLGAVRHGGFIPWDDDIDIALPRHDYERLRVLLERELPHPFVAVNHHSDPGYHYLWTQVRDPRVMVRLEDRPGRELQPCWVDVFPLDGVPAPGLRRRLWKLSLDVHELLWGLSRLDEASVKAAGRSRGKSAVMRWGSRMRVNRILNEDAWTRRRDRALRRHPFDEAGTCLNAVGAYKFGSVFDVPSIYGAGADYAFEDLVLRGPADFERYLTQIYGDYRKPPAPGARNHHGTRVHAERRFAVGYTQGTFDMFHTGHLRLIERARQLCDHLVVGVNADALVQRYKGKTTVIGQDERLEVVRALRDVDEAILVDTLDKTAILSRTPYQAIFIGDDWKGTDRWTQTERELNSLGVEVVFLSYTEGVSSTALRTEADQRVPE